MFLRRCFAVSFLLIFFSLCGCQSFLALAKAMGEDEDTPAPRRLKHNERERKSDSLIEMPRDEETKQSETKTKTKVPDDGFFRLVLNEKKGSFSLYFLADPVSMRYESLFNSSDPSASYITVYFDSNVYKLGSSKHFKTRLARIDGAPAIIYESSFLILTQIFTPIRTSSSNVANGVMVTLTAENIGTQMSSVGIRMLIDTDLGEGRRQVPFITNTQIISSELLLEGNSEERFWVSRGKNTALMGSIVSPFEGEDNEKGPDAVHIANWKRLNDTPWKLRYMEGRSFNYIPNSIRDSAVCYYFGPSMLDRGDLLSYKIYLTTEDIAWYNLNAPLPVATASILEKSTASAAPEKKSRRQSSAAASSVQTQDTAVPPVQAAVPQAAPVVQPVIIAAEPAVDPAALIPPPPVYIDAAAIDITLIEQEAKTEAEYYYKDGKTEFNVNVLLLMKLQDVLDQFIDGHIVLNEQDLYNIEGAIEKLKVRN